MRDLTNLRPPRARCERCAFRFELIYEVGPEDPVACPRCHVVLPPTLEPADDVWWQWATGPVAQVTVSNVTPIRSAPPAIKANRSIGVQV